VPLSSFDSMVSVFRDEPQLVGPFDQKALVEAFKKAEREGLLIGWVSCPLVVSADK